MTYLVPLFLYLRKQMQRDEMASLTIEARLDLRALEFPSSIFAIKKKKEIARKDETWSLENRKKGKRSI